MSSFTERFGHEPADAEITVREDAPSTLRDAVSALAYRAGLTPSAVRTVVCPVLMKAPDPSNWSERPNIEGEVYELLHNCAWFEVYDIIEALIAHMVRAGGVVNFEPAAVIFAADINRFFRRSGIGWQLVNGRIEVRGPEAFELAVRQGRDDLWAAGKQTAATELHEALTDLSRRPIAEVTGAIQHAMAALECVARDKCSSKDTLGDLIRRNADLFPKPIDVIIDKAWGFTSNYGRHLQEGKVPTFDEAELVVGVAGVLCRYLVRKLQP